MNKLITSSRRRRIFAFMIDHIIMCFLGAMGGFLALGKYWDVADPDQMMSSMVPTMIILFIVYFMKDSIFGMSPGRYVLGISLRDNKDYSKCPNIFRLALRNLTIVIWPIEFLVLAISKQKRRLGDLLGKTVVIRRDDIQVQKRLVAFVGLILIFGVLFAGGTSSIIKNTMVYEDAISHLKTSEEVKEQLGDITGFGLFPTGSIQVQNQYGSAQIQMKVIGTKGSAPVVVIMQKEPEADWELKALEIIN